MDKKSEPKSKARSVGISPARLAAYEILLKIEREKAFSSVILPVYEEKLSPVDRALCHELTLGVLRRKIYLDKIIESFAGGKKIDLEVKIILRLGLYQLLFLDKIPAYSAINESVNMVGKAKKTSAKGFVNAILRKASQTKIELKFNDEVEKIAVETSHPRWLIDRWISQFGLDETQKIAEANNRTPELNYRWTAKTTEAVKKSLKNQELQPKFLRELAENGKIYFQDLGSQIVGQAVNLQAGEKFLDVCAAPGSKLTQIATVAKQTVYGGDLHFRRVQTTRDSAKKQGLSNVAVLQYDAENALPFAAETFDVILLDAPCSGTGTIRHNPEIRYFLEEKDFAELSAKQLETLREASKLAKPLGRLIYSTCSLERDENESVIAKFLAENAQFSLIESAVGTDYKTNEGYARVYPQKTEADGFFIATLQKTRKANS